MPTEIAAAGAALWLWSPNWRDGYQATYEFRTDIFTSRSQREQRRALRTTPRRAVSFTATRTRGQMQALDRFIYRNQHRDVLIPDLLRTTECAGVVAGAAATVVPFMPDWLVPGQDIILVDGGRQAAFSVVSITETVNFSVPSPDAWPAGTLIHPALLGALANSISVSRVTDDTAEVSVSVSVRPGVGLADPVGVAADIFNGREILPLKPNRIAPIDTSFAHMTESVDFGRGRISTVRPVAFGSRLSSLQFLLGSPTEINAMVDFFCRMKGQRGEFYASTDQSDLTVTGTVAADTTVLVFAGTDLADTYGDDTVHRAILVHADNGYSYPRRVVSILPVAGQSVMTLAIGLPVVVTSETKISWFLVHRSAVDMLTVSAVTDGVAQTQLAVTSLEDLPPEDPLLALDEGAQWMLDYYGWNFTLNVIQQPLHDFVHVQYPRIAGLDRFTSAEWWLGRTYGYYVVRDTMVQPLHDWVHDLWPSIAPA